MSKVIIDIQPSKNQYVHRVCLILAWGTSFIVTLLAILAWGRDFGWQLSLNPYQVFPLLGLLAFSLMWSHYVAATIRSLLGVDKEVLGRYFSFTSWAVLALICLHPSLLIYQRFRDGFGLPPGSYESYVAPGLGWVTLLGTASLLVFLAYEFHRIFENKPWWHFIQKASDVAMLAILYHALRIGSQIHGWYRIVWWFYAVVLIGILARTYIQKYMHRAKKTIIKN